MTAEPSDSPSEVAPGAALRLAHLRDTGAWRIDPARFHFLEALSRRLPAAAPAVREQAERRLLAALADYEARVAPAREAAALAAAQAAARQPGMARELRRLQAQFDMPAIRQVALRARARPGSGPLARLHRSPGGDALKPEPSLELPAAGELASAQRFRRMWTRQRAQDQVQQAVTRKPVQAGPLNSHMLVLEALDRMRALSPDYLRHFVQQVESLQWLEQASQRPAGAKGARGAKGSSRPRSKRSG